SSGRCFRELTYHLEHLKGAPSGAQGTRRARRDIAVAQPVRPRGDHALNRTVGIFGRHSVGCLSAFGTRSKAGRLSAMEPGLRMQAGGSGQPVLLLLHGLGATGDVWDAWRPLLAKRWPGRWLAPDLPGHGGAAPASRYTFDTLAAAVAGLIEPGARVVVLGHSLGGVVGLALAGGGSARSVQAVVGLGIKVVWSEEDLDRARTAARRPPMRFDS